MSKKTLLVCCVPIMVALTLVFHQLASSANAQGSATHWEQPIILFDSGEPGTIYSPLVVEDTGGRIKILWEVISTIATKSSDLPAGIYCIDGDGSTWSEPVDVIAAPDDQRTFWPEYTMDTYGRLHMVWVGSNARLFYSRAPSAEACDARSWTTAVLPAADQVSFGDIAIDAAGNLHVVYAARGKDIYHIRSEDDGLSWSEPVAVSTVSPTIATAYPTIAVDSANVIHVAWEEVQLPDGIPSLGLYYALSDDEGSFWSTPTIFSQIAGEYTQPNLVALDDGTIQRFWNGRISTKGRYNQWSQDGGHTWSAVTEVISKDMGGGQTGPPRIATDSIGRLHLVSGTDAVTYTVWDGDNWLAPPANIMPYLEYPNIAIANGNVVHVVAMDNQRIWYVRGVTDAPEADLDFEVLPTPEVQLSQVTAVPTNPPQPTPTPQTRILPPALTVSQQPGNSVAPALLGAGLALLVVVGAVVLVLIQRRS